MVSPFHRSAKGNDQLNLDNPDRQSSISQPNNKYITLFNAKNFTRGSVGGYLLDVELFNFEVKKGRVVLGLFLLLAITACQESKMPSLASVTSVSPGLVEPGEVLVVNGAGFVQGLAHILLEGKTSSGGTAEPENKSVYLRGNAVSANVVEIQITSRTMRDLALEPTTFKGNLEVSFPTSQSVGTTRITARSEEIELEFRPAGEGIPLAAKKTRQATKFLSNLGIELANSKNSEGLLISDVNPQSPADLAGVVFGDRLLAVDGTALANVSDLSGVKSKDSYRFDLVSRAGAMKDAVVTAKVQTNLAPDEFLAIVLSSIALGLFLAFSAPAARWFARPAAQTTNPALRAIGFGIVSMPLAVLPAVSILSKAGYGATVFLSGITISALAIAMLFREKFSFRQVGRFFAHALPIPAMIIVAGACGSALGLWDIVASQQAVPWGWHAWSSPFALVAVIGSLVLIWPSSPGHNNRKSHFASAINWTVAICAASMVTACCLGGWLVPGVPVTRLAHSGWLLATGCMIFFAKTWTVLVISRWFASVGVVERRTGLGKRNLLPRIIVTASAAALTLGWMWTDISIPYRVAGQVLAIAACVTFFTVLTTAVIKNARRSFS